MDPASQVLAWQVHVACGLARECEQVVVLTHREVPSEYPPNLRVHLLPAILLRAPLRWVGGKWMVNFYVWRLCARYRLNACFIHMNMVWAIFLAPVFRLRGMPVLLWYAHGTVTRRLRWAHRFVSRVVTSTPEGFRISSHKVAVIGQGVDTSQFRIEERTAGAADIITVGRLSEKKRVHLMIECMELLWAREPAAGYRLVVVGAPLTAADREYEQDLLQRRAACSRPESVVLAGKLRSEEIGPLYRSAFVHLNLSETGSMDKTVMESLAAGCPVVTTNVAFAQLLAGQPASFLAGGGAAGVAEALLHHYRLRHTADRQTLRGLVVGKHDLDTFGRRVLDQFARIKTE